MGRVVRALRVLLLRVLVLPALVLRVLVLRVLRRCRRPDPRLLGAPGEFRSSGQKMSFIGARRTTSDHRSPTPVSGWAEDALRRHAKSIF